jgi:NADH-quinone oxidoreductase subunit E
MLTEQTKAAIIRLQNQYPNPRSALIPALHLAQKENGYLPRDVQNEIAHLFHIDPNEVNAIVTFYDMFYEEPVGKHILHVCKNASCMLRGCDQLLQQLCHKLGIKPGETTADGEFTVISSECLAACDRAPMILVDKQVIGPVKECDLEEVLEKAKKSEGHPSPVNIETSHG